MNSNEGMKYFQAVSYDGDEYNFVVTPEGKICCIEFGMEILADKLDMKPSFILCRENGSTVYKLDDYLRERNAKKPNSNGHLICNWKIEPEIFEYLKTNKKIVYSRLVAEIYGFEDLEYASDARHQARFFKKTRNNPKEKARILSPIKDGKFH